MYRLLIVCTGNTCRSPMLETLIKDKVKKLNKSIEVKSVGLRVLEGDKVSEKARKALKKYGLVIRHKPTQITEKALERADTIITVTDDHKYYLKDNKCAYKIFSLRETVGFNIPDPYGQTDVEYANCAEKLDYASGIIVENLLKVGKI